MAGKKEMSLEPKSVFVGDGVELLASYPHHHFVKPLLNIMLISS
jgi:hypothetical protein